LFLALLSVSVGSMSHGILELPRQRFKFQKLSPYFLSGMDDEKFPKVEGGGSLILAWQIRNKRVLVVGGGEVSLWSQMIKPCH